MIWLDFTRPFTAVDPVLIRGSKDLYGWMGNMSPFPVTYEEKEYRTTEALFQCLRVSDEETRELIRAEKSPMAAKFKAKALDHMRTVECLSEADLDLMRLCLRLKIEQHPQLRLWLLQTAELPIIEDCSRRPHGTGLFWGAKLLSTYTENDGLGEVSHGQSKWSGMNKLGELWMELREQEAVKNHLKSEPDIFDLF